MAVQHGPIQLTGQLGGVSYYEMNGKYYARRKTAHSAERIRTDPAFKSTYQNSLEFGRASKASRLLRKAWKAGGGVFSDSRMYSRLCGCLRRVVQGDMQHCRGDRTVTHGDFTQLLNFELNKHKSFNAWCPSRPVVRVNRKRGEITLALTPQREFTSVSRKHEATLVIHIACINFEDGTHHAYHYACKLTGFASGHAAFKAPRCSDPQTAVITTLGVSHNEAMDETAIEGHGVMAIVGVEAPANARLVPAEMPHPATPATLAIDAPVNILRHSLARPFNKIGQTKR